MTLSVMEYCQHSPSTPSSAHNSAAITPAPTPTAIFHCPADAVGAAPVDCDVVGDVVTPERDCPASEVVVAVVCDGGGTVSVWVIALDAPPAVLLLSEIGGTVSVCVDTLDALLVSEIGGMEKALEVVETGGPDALTGVVLVTITVELSERGTVSRRSARRYREYDRRSTEAGRLTGSLRGGSSEAAEYNSARKSGGPAHVSGP
ncbi:hypothetical protein POSPLADRAFT_1039673 [Postia placenta MAD-698-R-SB12]|uniref:Uncharacterized protein n=1 Tax=Postia placenta MAD-698-R-SB12 TaxID=670580 RepID=A0A1X6N1X6_9APHY|nr:hypothetical protein POSPLADRAFT_1039673 [Postia placenta MAD-698-R-SB12]OSX62594.1 hypothetical protein POSPLADRAFT_1039673 [Postia placenta MAD-698-R-SB12]